MSEWTLNELRIEKASFSNKSRAGGKTHVGRVQFVNKEYEHFAVNVPPAEMEKLLNLVRDWVIQEARLLGDRIARSMEGGDERP